MEFSIGSIPGKPARTMPMRQLDRLSERPTLRGRLLSDVFDFCSAGILIGSLARRVLTWNRAATSLLGDNIDSGVTCCQVFPCHMPGTPLADACISDVAATFRDETSRAPEIVIEPRGRPGTRVAVTATPLSGGRVLFEVRAAGASGDTEVGSHGGTKIRVRTLGETIVEIGPQQIRDGWLDQRTGRLFKFLVAHRFSPIHADAIAEALWPRARADSTNTVRHFVHLLRERLEPERSRYQRSAFVLARHGGYVLNAERVTVDADDFEREATAGMIAMAANDRDAAPGHLRRAIDLYRGDFLADERFDDWAIAERERLRDLAAKQLRALGTLTADPDEAVRYLERLADMEPLDVEIHRELIGAWLHQGRRGRAIRHYRVLQSRLMRELGERVNFDLGELMFSAGSHPDRVHFRTQQ